LYPGVECRRCRSLSPLPQTATRDRSKSRLAWEAALPRNRHATYRPASIYIIVEVAQSSLARDRDLKGPLYARAGIPEYWLVDLDACTIAVCRPPSPDGYRRIDTAGDVLAPAAFPDSTIATTELWV